MEDRGFFVLVDRDDHFGIFHARHVLDRTGDADGDVEFRRNHLSGLADLVVVRHEACIDRGARCADGSAEFIGQRFQDIEVLTRTHAAAAGNDDTGLGQFRAFRLGQFAADEGGQASIASAIHSLDASRAAGGGRCVERRRADSDDFDAVRGFYRRQRVAGIDGAHEGIGILDLGNFRDLGDVQQGGGARHDVFAVVGCTGQNVRVAAGNTCNQFRHVLCQSIGIDGIVCAEDLGDAGDLAAGGCRVAATLARNQQVNVGADLNGCGYRIAGRRCDLTVIYFSYNKDAHQITFASDISLETSSCTSATLPPPSRFGGSATCITWRRGAVSTPRSAGLTSSIGFFFAFMMLGSEA